MRDTTKGVLVVGDSFVDVLAGPLPRLPSLGTNVISPKPIAALPGGAALNVAANLRRLRGDVEVSLFTGLGSDAFGEIPRAHCAALGVRLLEAEVDQCLPTGVCLVLSGSTDRAFCSHFGVSDAFDAAQLLRGGGGDGPLASARHLHVSGFYSCAALRKTLPALLRRAAELGVTTSLDTNHDATGEWGRKDGLWETVLPLVDVFLPNESEACAIAATSGTCAGVSTALELRDALPRLAARVRGCAVVTLGSRGAVIARRGADPAYVSAPAVGVVDTTGAGDAFKAGFLSRYVAGAPFEECATYGAVAGACCVSRRATAALLPAAAKMMRKAQPRGHVNGA
eukprot:g2929.t1